MSNTSPRWLDRDALEAYISIPVGQVQRLQRGGKLPEPSLHLGPPSPRWDRQAVDALFGEAALQAEHDALVAEAVADILAEPPKRRRKAAT